MFRPDLLQGARILVTGGGTGLGRIMAMAFARLGARVYICGRRGAVLQETAAAIDAEAGANRCSGWVCDLRDPDSIDALIERIWADGGALTGNDQVQAAALEIANSLAALGPLGPRMSSR